MRQLFVLNRVVNLRSVECNGSSRFNGPLKYRFQSKYERLQRFASLDLNLWPLQYLVEHSLFEDDEYEGIVDETITEVNTLSNRNPSEKWEIFLLIMKTKSIHYSTIKNKAKRKIKNELIRQMTKIEEKQETEDMQEH